MKHSGKKDELRRYVIDGSHAAFSRLVERYIKLVYSTCYRELGQRELAEEATQAVFIALAQKAKTIRSEAELLPWLYTVARYEARDVRRQEKRRLIREERGAEEMLRRTHEREMDSWEAIELRLNDALSALSLSDRQAILMRYFDQMSLREVGRAFGTNEEAARKRVSRAIDKLREALAEGRVTDLRCSAQLSSRPARFLHRAGAFGKSGRPTLWRRAGMAGFTVDDVLFVTEEYVAGRVVIGKGELIENPYHRRHTIFRAVCRKEAPGGGTYGRCLPPRRKRGRSAGAGGTYSRRSDAACCISR